ncbi:hypothetical protein MPSEU_001045800 [Mayamaea pseudoterrestris]|nr:hypothetical protein MPSEU_001045800 [Mayamaea pseudoterrestris]
MTKASSIEAVDKTPPRSSLQCARSPIASIKRPRGGKSPMRGSTGNDTTLSPLHPPRQPIASDDITDVLFSPGLHVDHHPDSPRRSELGSDDSSIDAELKNNDTEPTSLSTMKESPNSLEDSMEDVESLQGLEENESPDEEEFNPWQFIKSLPPYSRVSHLLPPITLPPKTMHDKITLVLDLDETLVHCTVEPIVDADFLFDVVFHGVEYSVHVKLRPYLSRFLDSICGQYEVVIFTASQKVYADQLLDRIDPENKYFHHRLFRESCLSVEGNFLKDLNVLGRDLSQTVLVDNSPHAFGYQVDNGIPIESWFDSPHDKELMKLERFLRTNLHEVDGKPVPDVRTVLAAKFECQKLIDNAPEYLAGCL